MFGKRGYLAWPLEPGALTKPRFGREPWQVEARGVSTVNTDVFDLG